MQTVAFVEGSGQEFRVKVGRTVVGVVRFSLGLALNPKP